MEDSSLLVPDIHLYADAMVAFALEVREKTNAPWCMLPFCHTVEAETLGAKVRYGDRKNGPRVVDYACSTLDDLLTLPDMDFTQGRIAQVLAACRELHRRGETVILEITGPFTLLGGLIDPASLFRFLRKEPEKMEQVFAHLHRNLLAYMQVAQESGVSIISYADPTGGVNIIGRTDGAKLYIAPSARDRGQASSGHSCSSLSKDSFCPVGYRPGAEHCIACISPSGLCCGCSVGTGGMPVYRPWMY